MLEHCKIPLLVAVLLSSLGFGTEGACLAQVRRYQPRRPTTSPYLQLTRRNTGALPNYHALVRPAQRQQAINQQAQASRRQQAGAIQRLQNSVQLGLQPAGATGKRGGFQVPSSRSAFGTSGRYFRTNNNALGRQ
jgi:hypothetical protein